VARAARCKAAVQWAAPPRQRTVSIHPVLSKYFNFLRLQDGGVPLHLRVDAGTHKHDVLEMRRRIGDHPHCAVVRHHDVGLEHKGRENRVAKTLAELGEVELALRRLVAAAVVLAHKLLGRQHVMVENFVVGNDFIDRFEEGGKEDEERDCRKFWSVVVRGKIASIGQGLRW